MNIFYLHEIAMICAQMHADKHVIKMILETAQLLCTAVWLSGGEAPYKATHKNHPSAIWARASKQNWIWLRELGLELCKEYKYRYGEHKEHKTQKILESLECPPDLPDIPFTPPPQAMPDHFKHEDTVTAYRRYYLYGKSHLHSWKKREIPSWVLMEDVPKINNS